MNKESDFDTWHYYQKNELLKKESSSASNSLNSKSLNATINKFLLNSSVVKVPNANYAESKVSIEFTEPDNIVDLLLLADKYQVDNSEYFTDALYNPGSFVQQRISFYQNINSSMALPTGQQSSFGLQDLKNLDLSGINQDTFYEMEGLNSRFQTGQSAALQGTSDRNISCAAQSTSSKKSSPVNAAIKNPVVRYNSFGKSNDRENRVDSIIEIGSRKRAYEIPSYNPANKYILNSSKPAKKEAYDRHDYDNNVVYDYSYDNGYKTQNKNSNIQNQNQISNQNINSVQNGNRPNYRLGGSRTMIENSRYDNSETSDGYNSGEIGEEGARKSDFITAKQQMTIEQRKKENGNGNRNGSVNPNGSGSGGRTQYNNNKRSYNDASNNGYPPQPQQQPKRKVLGQSGRARFNPPLLRRGLSTGTNDSGNRGGNGNGYHQERDDFADARNSVGAYNAVGEQRPRNKVSGESVSSEVGDERLRNVDPKMIEIIKNEIMYNLATVEWDDIAGLEHAKKSIMEIVVWPMLRPDVFKGLRGPPKGLLLFGPPGTGKTLIGKCIASQSCATFFSISSSTLTSKWVGEGEKMVKALFAVARVNQPSVIFIDEIDSLLTQRTDGEMEATRRIKTEFLVQFDGCGTTADEDRILVIGATNRPQEIDEAARRRFRKRLYIPLPGKDGRKTIITNLLKKQGCSLNETEIEDISVRTDGYSGSDMDGLCREAALGPIRAVTDIQNVNLADIEPISHKHFVEALKQIRASVSQSDLQLYLDWDASYGSMGM